MAGYSYGNSFDVRIKLNTDPNLTPNPIRTHDRVPNPNRPTSRKKTLRPVGVVKHGNWIWDRRLQVCRFIHINAYHNLYFLLAGYANTSLPIIGGGYRSGSPTAVQAWQPCPLWEPSPSLTPYYCRLGGLLCYTCMLYLSNILCVLCMCNLCFLCFLGFFPLQLPPSVLWYCWLGLLTCKNRLPYNLYCVGGDVKHCSIQSNPIIRPTAGIAYVMIGLAL